MLHLFATTGTRSTCKISECLLSIPELVYGWPWESRNTEASASTSEAQSTSRSFRLGICCGSSCHYASDVPRMRRVLRWPLWLETHEPSMGSSDRTIHFCKLLAAVCLRNTLRVMTNDSSKGTGRRRKATQGLEETTSRELPVQACSKLQDRQEPQSHVFVAQKTWNTT